MLVGLVIATLGAVLFGGVLGALPRLVVQERVPVPASGGLSPYRPGVAGLAAGDPARGDQRPERPGGGVDGVSAGRQPGAGVGPLLGLSPSLVLGEVTSRWAWWIGANLLSWLLVNAAILLLSQVFGGLSVITGSGSIAEVSLSLIATTPLTGRMLLWVLAPSALAVSEQPHPA